MKFVPLCLVVGSLILSGCGVTLQELNASGDSIKKEMNTSVAGLSEQNAALKAQIDSLRLLLEESALVQKRLVAELTVLANRVANEANRNDSRQEENRHRLDMLLGKSDKILAKKVVVNNGAAPVTASSDMDVAAAERRVEAEAMFNAAKADYHRAEYKLAYSGFKQVYEQTRTGELAENALYWMGLCLEDAEQIDKAKIVYNKIIESFPNSLKSCTAMYKIASIYGDECDIVMKKQFLQMILSSQLCASSSGEFEQAAALLQEILTYKPINGKSQEQVCRENLVRNAN